MFGTAVSSLQETVVVGDSAITGTLKYYSDSSSQLVQTWGAGNFLALKFESNADVVLAGLDPSQGSGLVQLDDDMNGVWKITNKDTQEFVVKCDGVEKARFDLSGLTCEAEESDDEE